MEKIFLIKKRLADRLNIIDHPPNLLPRWTASSPKSESSKTTCAIFLVASFPDSIAILQSAVLRARISLTPSPVMATLCPFACKPSTRLFFCSGVTRPKTVYWLAAWCKSSSVSQASGIDQIFCSFNACFLCQ